MVRPDRDPIGGTIGEHVEIDETYVGGTTRGQGRGVHHQSLVIAAVEVRQRKPKKGQKQRRGGRYAGRIRLDVIPDRSAHSLLGFIDGAVQPGAVAIEARAMDDTITSDDLRAWRLLCGALTQDAAARRLKVPLRTYIGWENGGVIPRPHILALAMSAVHEGVSPWRTPADLVVIGAPRRGRPRKAIVI